MVISKKEHILGNAELKSELKQFVKNKGGSWNHHEWTGLLKDLEKAGHPPMNEEVIGVYLEEQKSIYHALNNPDDYPIKITPNHIDPINEDLTKKAEKERIKDIEANLDDIKKSNILRNFVKTRKGVWTSLDILRLMHDLKGAGFSISKNYLEFMLEDEIREFKSNQQEKLRRVYTPIKVEKNSKVLDVRERVIDKKSKLINSKLDDLKDLENDVKKRINFIAIKEQQIEKRLGEIDGIVNMKISKRSIPLDKREKLIEEMEKNLQFIESEIKRKESNITKKLKQYESFQNLEEQELKLNTKEKRLQKELRESKIAKEKFDVDKKNLEKTFISVKKEESELKELRESLEEASTELANRTEKNMKKERALKEIMKEYDTGKYHQVARKKELDKKIKSLDKERKQLEKSNSNLLKENRKLQKDHEILKRKNKPLKEKLEAIESKYNKYINAMKNIENKLDQRENKIKEQEELLDTREEDLNEQVKDLAKENQKLQKKEDDISAREKVVVDKEIEIDKIAKDVMEFDADIIRILNSLE